MSPDDPAQTSRDRARFRSTLVRVLVVQTVALVLLGLIQIVYNT